MFLATADIDVIVTPPLSGAMKDCSIARLWGCETLGILYSGWVRTLGILCGGLGRGVCGVASRLVPLTRDWLVGVNITDVVTYVRRSMPSN